MEMGRILISNIMSQLAAFLHFGGSSEGKRLHALDVVPVVTGYLAHKSF